MFVYELMECEEYEWQVSRGLFISEERAKAQIPNHTIEIIRDESGVILCLPEFAKKVESAYREHSPYWWYNLQNHGDTYEGEYSMMFYSIMKVEVIQ